MQCMSQAFLKHSSLTKRFNRPCTTFRQQKPSLVPDCDCIDHSFVARVFRLIFLFLSFSLSWSRDNSGTRPVLFVRSLPRLLSTGVHLQLHLLLGALLRKRLQHPPAGSDPNGHQTARRSDRARPWLLLTARSSYPPKREASDQIHYSVIFFLTTFLSATQLSSIFLVVLLVATSLMRTSPNTSFLFKALTIPL